MNTLIYSITAFFIIGLLVMNWPSAGHKQPQASTSTAPVVIELFTSQSCSSCPPADKLLGNLAVSPNIIALSCNVTYWNHLHWKDTLSREFCTQRQRNYAAAKRSNRVYTPQMVVNGAQEFVGSNSSKAHSAIKKAQANPLKNIEITNNSENSISITLPKLNQTGPHEITAFITSKDHTQSVPSGENRGKTIHYTNPVTDLIALGEWQGNATEKTFTINQITKDNAAKIVIIVNKGQYGDIVAAGQLSL